MITMHTFLQAALTVLIGATAFAVDAQTVFESNASFVVADDAVAKGGTSLPATDPMLFGFTPSDPDLALPHPSYAGAWISQDTATPQARISTVRLYAYALETRVFQHIAARFRFWNAYQASASSVFSKPSEYVVDLTSCPCNFIAGNVYYVDIALPKPFYSETANLGFSQLWATDNDDGVLTVSTDLVPALDTSPGQETAGVTVAGYGNLGRSPDDLNFAPADEPGAGRLGLGLNGTSMTLDQCTGSANFQDQFIEEFDDASAFFQRWRTNPNNGTFTAGSGYLALSAADNAAQFPYITPGNQITMIPPTGNFEVRWLATYTGVGAAGDGEMVISKGTPLNGNDGTADPPSVALRSWQDAGGFHVFANTSGGVQTIGAGQGTTLHDMEYCWVDGNVEIWKDGQIILSQTAQPAQRPDSIWLGNPMVTAGGPWNPVTVYRVLVRGDQATISDHIFSDGFESPLGNQ